MSDGERKRAFAASALFIAAVVVVLSLTAPGQREPRRASAGDTAPTAAPPASVDAGAAAGGPADPAGDVPSRSTGDALPAREQHAAVRRARAFLTAYLRFEVGDSATAARRAIRRTATSDLARALRDPPRVAGDARPERGRIARLELGAAPSARGVEVVATIARGGSLTPLTVRLELEEGGWRVSGLG
jgi:hypothetical protein